MVMEEPPSPQCVGREFVRQYYTLLNKAPVHLHRFYNNASSFVHGGMDAPDRETAPVIGQKEIHNRIQQLNFRDCHAKISQVDSQATLGNGVVVQVTGELSNGGQPMRRFTQTFVLAAQSPKQYYVHNDIFRYQDLGFPDDDAEWEYSRPEAEQPQQAPQQPPPAALPAPYFPPAAPSAVQSPPQPAQLAPPISPPMPAQQLQEHAGHNGHQTDDGQGNISMPVSDSSCNDVDVGSVEMEPEEEMPIQQQSSPVQVAPIPHEPAPVISSEPKTYANLLKSGPISSFAQSLQQHHINTQPPPGMSGRVGMQRQEPPAPAPHQHHQQQQQQAPPSQQPQRQPRPQRTQRNDSTSDSGGQGSGNTPPGSGSSGLSRKYSDSQQLFLGNLPHQATKEELRTLFEKFGPIVDLRVYSKQVGGAGAAGPPGPGGNRVLPNYAFLIYEDSQSAHNCLNHGALYYPSEDSPDAQLLNVQEKKSRMGGGGGGGPPGGGGGRGSSGGGRSGPRPPRPSFNRGPYQPQQQNNPPRR